MWLGTGEERWKKEATRIATLFLQWVDGCGVLLAPYTSHSMLRVLIILFASEAAPRGLLDWYEYPFWESA